MPLYTLIKHDRPALAGPPQLSVCADNEAAKRAAVELLKQDRLLWCVEVVDQATGHQRLVSQTRSGRPPQPKTAKGLEDVEL